MKPFKKQAKECTENGTRYFVRCRWCGTLVIICDKYKTYCSSKACHEERKEATDD